MSSTGFILAEGFDQGAGRFLTALAIAFILKFRKTNISPFEKQATSAI
jgi:hypothetical protein